MVLGNFNEILSRDEKMGRRERPERQMSTFRIMIDDCHLKDLGYEGYLIRGALREVPKIV